MQADELARTLRQAFPKYRFELTRAGAGWFRILVQSKRWNETLWVTLGRISVDPQGSIWMKHYKPRDYEFKLEDSFFYLFWSWMSTGKVPNVDFVGVVRRAKQAKRDEIKRVKEWRRLHPKIVRFIGSPNRDCEVEVKKRKRIDTNWMGTFRKLIAVEIC